MIAPTAELLHKPLAALVQRYGAPAAVATRDDGQHVDFIAGGAELDAIIDDDARVRAVDVALAPGTPYPVDVDGTTHTVTFGTTTSDAARDRFAASAETEGPGFRVFARDAGSDLVLVFDPKTALLTHVITGDLGTLLRLGYLADPTPVQQRFPYSAPVLRHTGVQPGTGLDATVLRLDLDRLGIVRKVVIVVPSADTAFDAALAKRLDDDDYAPAKLGGRAIGASVFREVRH